MKVAVYIDGENLTHRIVDILKQSKLIKSRDDLQRFDVKALLRLITPEDYDLKDIYYYTTKLRVVAESPELEKLSRAMVQRNARWITALSNQGIKCIKAGNLKLRDGTVCKSCKSRDRIFQEKGVDVRLAVDMVQDACIKKYSRALIISSDSDLVPAVETARSHKMYITYIAPSKDYNLSMAHAADELLTFTPQQVISIYKQSNQGKKK
ncbi:MAG: NYN domain-containing protein [Candidatus Saccharimonadales bacterium]